MQLINLFHKQDNLFGIKRVLYSFNLAMLSLKRNIALRKSIGMFFCLVALSISIDGLSSHLIGGEIYYTHTTGNNYTVTLKIFRDCGPANVNGTGFDDAVSIGIFTSNNNLFDELSINLISTNVSTIPVVLNNPCFVFIYPILNNTSI